MSTVTLDLTKAPSNLRQDRGWKRGRTLSVTPTDPRPIITAADISSFASFPRSPSLAGFRRHDEITFAGGMGRRGCRSIDVGNCRQNPAHSSRLKTQKVVPPKRPTAACPRRILRVSGFLVPSPVSASDRL